MTLAAVPFDVVQLVVQGGAAGVLLILGLKVLSVVQELLTTEVRGLRDDMGNLTGKAEKMIDRLDLILTATLAPPIATTVKSKAEQVAKLKEDVAMVVEQTAIIKNGGDKHD